ncbi:hypothetical protein J2Z65_001988 [Paenibacillus aceris]|uniref:Uncharacterized protein n=1 Tax=Paenibacillus aceris TaxID=869555 RepID=A0ABS4HVX1_9BACL|nr:hypothetical protein [Paenibacillus aceris]
MFFSVNVDTFLARLTTLAGLAGLAGFIGLTIRAAC